MVDYIKGEIKIDDISSILNNSNLVFHGRYNKNTGEANENKLIAYYEGLQFTIVNSQRLFIQGSLPKYYFGNNYQNLMYSDFLKVIRKLELQFGIDPRELVFQNIEFGLSVDTKELNPFNFLESEVIDYKVTTKEINTHNGKGYTISFPLNNYIVKLYDKGKQYNLESNLLRFEIRVKKMVHVKKTRIKTLHDLKDIGKWDMLKEFLVKTFDDILICKYQEGTELTIEESSLYRKGSNQQFWIKHWPNSKKYPNGTKDHDYLSFRNKYYKMRVDFNEFISNYSFDKNKQYILGLISKEIDKILSQ
jgi:hypothetical protein